jgi:hypothetical protein
MRKFFVIVSVLLFFVTLAIVGDVGAQAPMDHGISKNPDTSWKVRKVEMGGSFIIAYGSSSSGIPEIESRYNAKSNVIEVAVINGGERNTLALEESKKRAIALSYKVGKELSASCGAQLCYAKSHAYAGGLPVPLQVASLKKAPANAPKTVSTPAPVAPPVSTSEGKASPAGDRIVYSNLPPCKCKPGNTTWEGKCDCNFQDGMENEKVIFMLRWVSPARFSKGLGEPYSRLNHVTFVQDNASPEALAERDAYGQH